MNAKPKQAWPRKKREEKDLFPAADKESMGVNFQRSALLKQIKGGDFIQGDSTYSYRKTLSGLECL
jgi:hypothetical protein